MAKYYLTTSPLNRCEKYLNDTTGRFLAIISIGHPQLKSKKVTVCNLEIVPTQKDAETWFKRWLKERKENGRK